MDKDGKEENLFLIPEYEEMYSYYWNEECVGGDLWLVDSNGIAYKILEKEDVHLGLFLYETEESVYVVVNIASALVNNNGYVIGYRNGEISLRDDFRGAVGILENGELVSWAESYMGICDSTEDEKTTVMESSWRGHTWIPYYYYYSEEKNEFVPYEAKEVSREEVCRMAELDETLYKDAAAVQYIYVMNGCLEINIAELDGDVFHSVYFYNFEFRRDSNNGQWVLTRKRGGIYCLNEHADIQWDFLEQPLEGLFQ